MDKMVLIHWFKFSMQIVLIVGYLYWARGFWKTNKSILFKIMITLVLFFLACILITIIKEI
jgi:hypothetical protein